MSGIDRAGGVVVEVLRRVAADEVTGQRGCVLIGLRGAVVAATVDALTAGLDRALRAGANVVLDLSAVTVLDPAGAAVLAVRSQTIRTGGSWLVLTSPSPAVRAVLDRAPRSGRPVRPWAGGAPVPAA